MTAETAPYGLPVPDLFHPEQIITQLVGSDDYPELPPVAVSRVVHSVGEKSITLSTPSAPSLGVQEWGDSGHPLAPQRPLSDLLPPNVGATEKVGLPRINRTLVNRLGMILTASRVPETRVTCRGAMNSPLTEAWVFAPPRLARYVYDLVKAYLPYAHMDVTLIEPTTPFARDRVIIVKPLARED